MGRDENHSDRSQTRSIHESCNRTACPEAISNIQSETEFSRKGMTVKEMGDLLGLKKTERYWLVHKNVFKTKVTAGKMWVDVESFEKWYANQIKYKKVNGEEPGRELNEWSYSVRDISELLGICEQGAYTLIKTEDIKTVIVDHWMRIPKESFNRWYYRQDHYLTQEDRERQAEIEASTISMPQMAVLLGVRREQIYYILDTSQYRHFFEIIKLAGRRRVTKECFERFLHGQEHYRLVTDLDENNKNKNAAIQNNLSSTAAEGISTSGSRGLPERPIQTLAPKPEYISLAEAASLADISRQAVSKFATQGYFGMKKCGSVTRINRRQFESWLNNRNRTCRPTGSMD